MFNLGSMQQKMMDRFFRRVDNVVWDLMSGKIGIVTDDGIACLEGTGDDAEVEINLMEQFGVALPAFAQKTAISEVKVGDLIIKGKNMLGWITKVPTAKRKSFQVLKPDGMSGNFNPPKVTMIGFGDVGGVMVLRSLINSLPGGNLGNMQNLVMPLLMMGGDMDDMEELLPMILFNQMGFGGKEGDTSGMGNMLQTMMMMKVMSGGKSGLLGGSKKKVKTLGGGTNYFDD